MPLPRFNLDIAQIPVQLTEHTEKNLQHINKQLNTLEKDQHYQWDTLLPLLESLENNLQQFWSPVAHLHAVQNTPALREVYQNCLPHLTDYSTKLSQHEKLYLAFKQLQESTDYAKLNPAQQRVIDLYLRDFRLAGIHLPAAEKARYAEIQQTLAVKTTQFGEHVLDSTQAWQLLITDPKQLAGLPELTQQAMQQAAQQQQKTGWLATLDYPCYSAIVKYAEDRTLRETCYHAYVTRASDCSPEKQWDNTALMQEILQLRHSLAQLLGFNNYAELSLATKMVEKPQQVLDFLQDLVRHARPAAQREFAEITAFAGHPLAAWDVAFYSEKMRQQRYALSQEMLRPYFPLPKVLQGLFNLVQQIFGLRISPVNNIEVWHPEVKCFAIHDAQQQLRGYFYTDLYVRQGKQSGAWMDDFCSRWRQPNGELQHPVAYLTCNFAAPQADQPALLTHDDVITLFHEFGHGLHHLLTTVDYLDVAGIHGVPWDAVEFPSQFMENWCWQPAVLRELSAHYQTSGPLPENLLQALTGSQHFHAALQLIRQLEFALFDFQLHLRFDPQTPDPVNTVLHEIREQISVVPVPDYQRFQHTFTHVFDGSYAAGYYSYLWAEVLASDAFTLFEEHGLLSPEIGQRFLNTVLAQGGSRLPLALFTEFRGRAPDPKALLRTWGLMQ